jgi:hypothetical protein
MGRGGAAVRVFIFETLTGLSHEMDLAFEDIHGQF